MVPYPLYKSLYNTYIASFNFREEEEARSVFFDQEFEAPNCRGLTNSPAVSNDARH